VKGCLNVRKSIYVLIILCAIVAAGVWIKFSYPRFAHIDLSVSRSQATEIASAYISNKEHVDLSSYKIAVVFNEDTATDVYLQKSIGFQEEEKFIQKHQYDFFAWSVRFFKEGQKEEYSVAVSSKTGEVLLYRHAIEDSAAKEDVKEDAARSKAEEFLKNQFGFDLTNYVFNSKTSSKFDHRIEYTVNWEKKDVYILWDKAPDSGGGKLLTSVMVSGNDVLAFNKQVFSAPDQFNRNIERRKESGRNLGIVAHLGSLAFFIGAIMIVVLRRNHLAMNVTKRFYIGIIVILFALTVISGLNNAQAFIIGYPTTQPFTPFIIRQIIYEVMGSFLFFICFIIPCLAGELLRYEVSPKSPQGGMFHYLTTTFFARNVAQTILLGYCFAVIMMGLQAVIFEFGYRYCGVWVEQTRLNHLSTGYFPFLGILALAVNASVTEETFYRLFGLNFGMKIFRYPIIAILVSSVLWGLGHTGYMVFPFWFRGLEVTILGIFTSIIYLRFGLICVVVQHFLFDAFWAGSPYLFGHSGKMDFTMSLAVLSLPLVFAFFAFVRNQPVIKTKVEWRLNAQQKFNLEILKGFIKRQSEQGSGTADALRAQLIDHGWDVAVVDVAFQQLGIGLSESTAVDP